MNKECLIQKGLELMSTDIEKYLCQTCVKSAKFNPGNHKKPRNYGISQLRDT